MERVNKWIWATDTENKNLSLEETIFLKGGMPQKRTFLKVKKDKDLGESIVIEVDPEDPKEIIRTFLIKNCRILGPFFNEQERMDAKRANVRLVEERDLFEDMIRSFQLYFLDKAEKTLKEMEGSFEIVFASNKDVAFEMFQKAVSGRIFSKERACKMVESVFFKERENYLKRFFKEGMDAFLKDKEDKDANFPLREKTSIQEDLLAVGIIEKLHQEKEPFFHAKKPMVFVCELLRIDEFFEKNPKNKDVIIGLWSKEDPVYIRCDREMIYNCICDVFRTGVDESLVRIGIRDDLSLLSVYEEDDYEKQIKVSDIKKLMFEKSADEKSTDGYCSMDLDLSCIEFNRSGSPANIPK